MVKIVGYTTTENGKMKEREVEFEENYRYKEDRKFYEMNMTHNLPQMKKLFLWHNALEVGSRFNIQRAMTILKLPKSIVYKYTIFARDLSALKYVKRGVPGKTGLGIFEKISDLPSDAHEHWREEINRKRRRYYRKQNPKAKSKTARAPKPKKYTPKEKDVHETFNKAVVDADGDMVLMDRQCLNQAVDEFVRIIRNLAGENAQLRIQLAESKQIKNKIETIDMIVSLIPDDVRSTIKKWSASK
jgi:hypothetical protein